MPINLIKSGNPLPGNGNKCEKKCIIWLPNAKTPV